MTAADNIMPRHIAIIMDGNGRWAQEKNLPRVAGHHEGTKRVKEIVKAALEIKLEALTLFTFSTENWVRPRHEVEVLLQYFKNFLRSELPGMIKNNIRFRVIGRDDPVPARLIKEIREAEKKTAGNTALNFTLAVNYGSRQEIADAAKELCRKAAQGKIDPEELDERLFGEHLYTAGLPDPDLLIRTSGEVRLSNFLLWQLSYSEMYFTKTYWPDFRKEHLIEAIKEYQKRTRRFGDVAAGESSRK